MGRGGAALSSSTPDALWGAPAARVLRPVAAAVRGVAYGRLLDRCSLTVPVGARLLLIGQPDESASALVRVMAGLARPSRGRVEIAGMRDPSAEGWGRRVAHLGPMPGIHAWMTPREAITLAARLLEVPDVEAERRAARALAWAGIDEVDARRPVGRAGLPLLQRTGLAAALVGDPEVLLLDQPLRALDAAERVRLLRLPGRRRTVVLASRDASAESGIVTHVALIRDGRVATLARVSELDAAGLPLTAGGVAELTSRRAGQAMASSVGPARARAS